MINIFFKVLGYISLKWTIFYSYQFFISSTKWNQSSNLEGRLLAFFMLLAIPILELIILFFPIQWALKQSGWIVVFILFMVFLVEFLISYYATNQQIEFWMIVKIGISILLFILLFRKQLF